MRSTLQELQDETNPEELLYFNWFSLYEIEKHAIFSKKLQVNLRERRQFEKVVTFYSCTKRRIEVKQSQILFLFPPIFINLSSIALPPFVFKSKNTLYLKPFRYFRVLPIQKHIFFYLSPVFTSFNIGIVEIATESTFNVRTTS